MTTLYKIMYGSHVYGTENESSDLDLLEIVDRDSFSLPDIHIYTPGLYQRALDEHQIVPVETYMLITSTLDFPYTFSLDKWRLRQVFSATASNSWVKCKKKLADGETYIGLKSLFHSMRILDFGIQIASTGRINNFKSCKNLYEDIMKEKDKDWDYFKSKYQLLYNEWATEFKKLCPKPK